jgi:hypothetical protein
MLLVRKTLLEGFLSAIDSRRGHDPTDSQCVSKIHLRVDLRLTDELGRPSLGERHLHAGMRGLLAFQDGARAPATIVFARSLSTP